MGKRRTIGQQSRKNVDTIRDALYMRDDYRCVVSMTAVGADSACEGPISAQHRVGRGAGGSALFDGPAYLVVMCIRHNTLAESLPSFAKQCRENGWTLPRLDVDVDPESVPVRYWDGWYTLDADHCSRYRIDTREALDLIAAFWHQPKVDGGSTRRGVRA